MAFVNERLTEEQEKEFKSWGIKKPLIGLGRIIREVEMDKVNKWTADKERNIYLKEVSSDRDRPDERIFLFVWNNKNYFVQFTMIFEENNTLVWDIPQKCYLENTFPYCTEEHFIDDLRDAMLTFRWDGSPDEFNQNGTVKCNF